MMNEVLKHLLTLTIASSIAIVAALLVRRAVRHAFSASASYAVWLLVPIAMVAALLPHAAAVDPAMAPLSALSVVVNRSFPSALGASSSTSWSAWALGVWAAGAALSLAYMVRLQCAYMGSLGVLSRSIGILRAQGSAGCPALVGVFRPAVILPADFKTRYTPKERVLIVAHERVHLRRGDCVWNFLVALFRCLFWFNPLAHIAANTLRNDQELACDAAVIRRYPNSRRAYANAMLKTQLAEGALPAGCHWRSVQPLKERLEMLKHAPEGPLSRASGRVFVAVVSLAVGYCVWATEPASSASALGWVETGLPRSPVNVTMRSATITADGEAQFEQVAVTIGPPGNRLQITADHGYHRAARPPLLNNNEWTFAGNVVIHRDGRGYRRLENVRLRFSREGVWLEPTGGAPLLERPPPLLERSPPG
jgi:beta-lactamase regulating signal transducer with metallopeptidase domain